MQAQLIVETGRVLSVEEDSLWVETIQKSTCSGCAAKSGCGQNVLSSLVEKSAYLRVLLDGRSPGDFHRGSIVRIGIPANVIAVGSMIVYLLPVAGMIVGAALGKHLFASDPLSALCGFAGLFAGGVAVYLHHLKIRLDPQYQPVIVDDVERDCIKATDVSST